MRKLAATKRNDRAVYLFLGVSALALAPVGFVSAQTVVPTNAKPLCAVSPTTFASWFASGKPSLNGAVNPADSIKFPNQNDCNFYNWSAQMFLWLTSPAFGAYGSNGFVFTSPIFYNVSGAKNGKRTYSQNQPDNPLPLLNVRAAQAGEHGLQLVTDKNGQIFEVLPASQAKDGNSLVRNAAGKMIEIHRIEAQPKQKPKFFDAANKEIVRPKAPKLDTTLALRVAPQLAQVTPEETKSFVQAFEANGKVVFVDSNGNTIEPTQGQAGTSGVLLAQDQSLVYYATMVNDVYAYFQTGTQNGTFPAGPSGYSFFPTTAQQLAPVIKYAASKGSNLPDRVALTMELKTSWIDTAGLPALGLNPSDFITVKTTVPVYNRSNPKLWIPTGQTKPVTLAMVGMHVVGSVAGHPEMAWATFEQVSNAPSSAYQYTNVQGGTSSVPQGQAGAWAFASPKATVYNIQKADFKSAPKITAVSGQTISPSDTMLLKAWGTGSDAPNFVLENTEVISSDSSVLTQMPKGDVRANYIMTGATWTVKGQTVQSNNQIGTNLLNNSTMETYDQGINSQSNGSNCFSCHANGSQPAGQPANTAVSHIFTSLVPLYPKS
ncbi:hypothetical protein [Dyella flagellata]|uniref:Cytochrome c domain-containing protein n=1 Tax=Dyella flagellata TaxID=1867833 RepID=A0ABQ5X6Z0_9GAMM|nr:hypothetical protein [Dyella flagellata]GLQ87333.1 hypothetical protein GCM10007898_08990 [Dyella flagellata]